MSTSPSLYSPRLSEPNATQGQRKSHWWYPEASTPSTSQQADPADSYKSTTTRMMKSSVYTLKNEFLHMSMTTLLTEKGIGQLLSTNTSQDARSVNMLQWSSGPSKSTLILTPLFRKGFNKFESRKTCFDRLEILEPYFRMPVEAEVSGSLACLYQLHHPSERLCEVPGARCPLPAPTRALKVLHKSEMREGREDYH